MSLVIDPVPVPLATDDSGVVRVSGTRVTLDTIVIAYQQGEPPEIIADQYPTVPLADIYAVINYYLRHRREVDRYLAGRGRQAVEIRLRWEAISPTDDIRQTLAARRAATEPG